ncbi:hypothetical protein [Demequina sp.]|uniref:hypothetical protein n=1 Tax=Demequina sp. TaxID=2050685 RepID=UPI0025C463BC|nr:hypothetical protein [Demequina sp.]
MKSNTVLGVIGGILIAIAVFLTGDTIKFSGEAIKDTMSFILFIAALAIIAFSVMNSRTLTSYAAIVAATIVLIWFVELVRNDALDFSVRLILLLVGVVLALFASLGSRRN